MSAQTFPLVVAALLAAPVAQAAPTVHLQAVGLATVRAEGAGPGVGGRLVFEGERFGLEGGVRESAVDMVDELASGAGLAGSDGLAVGNIHLVARVPVGPLVLRAGLAHHHETAAPLVGRDPLRTTAGTHPGIVHRSGFEAGVEGLLPLSRLVPGGRWAERSALTAGLAADWMPGSTATGAGAWTGQLELGLRTRLGA